MKSAPLRDDFSSEEKEEPLLLCKRTVLQWGNTPINIQCKRVGNLITLWLPEVAEAGVHT
jgi:hypothetical protein